jgi:hypothetical protein
LSFIGGGETILTAFFSSALWQIYQTWYFFFRMQEYRFITPQDVGIIVFSMRGWDAHICLRFPDPTSPPSETSSQLLWGEGRWLI